MKYLFIIQGEGRGHMTQTISLFNILVSNGHEVCQIIVGKSARRKIPSFFYNQLKGCDILTIESPNFVTDTNNKSIKIGATVISNFKKISTFRKSLQTIDEKVKEKNPDVIVNFYDFLGGIFVKLYKPKCHFVCIAHQYLALHHDFPFAKGKLWDKVSLKLGNALTSLNADRILALSFSDKYKSNNRVVVTPPLLRKEVSELSTSNKGFILIYMVNDGYAEEVFKFHKQNPEIPLHCFWDRENAAETETLDDTLTFHQISDHKFLSMMSDCMAYASTAGFESICELSLIHI